MIRPIFIAIFFLSFLPECKTQNLEKMINEEYIMIDITSFDYVDGNGNKYSITTNTITYDPITPLESSTGTYSGGEPYTININLTQFETLQKTAMNCINKKDGQTKQRNKGTGTLIIQPGNKTYLFEMNSSQKKEIEEAIQLVTKK